MTVLHVGNNWAKIGIDAPADVAVVRDELLPDGPTNCCRCGGALPPPGPDGFRVTASTGCLGTMDSASGRCGVFVVSALWGDLPTTPERTDGAA